MSDIISAPVQINHAGLITGINQGSIDHAFVSSNITLVGANRVGGIAGDNTGTSATIANSFFDGNTAGLSEVGGISGKNSDGATITSSFSAGLITALSSTPFVGGITGLLTPGATGQVSHITNSITLANIASASTTASSSIGFVVGCLNAAFVGGNDVCNGNGPSLADDVTNTFGAVTQTHAGFGTPNLFVTFASTEQLNDPLF